MSIGSRRGFIRLAAAVNRQLSNCEVEISKSIGWASNIYTPTATPLVLDDAANVQVSGIYSDYHAEALNTDGHTLSVSIPALVSTNKTQFDLRILHGHRFAIKMLEYPTHPRMICKVRQSEPDGTHRILHYLHMLGPECNDASGVPKGYPYTFPFVFGAMSFNRCAKLEI